MIDRQSVYVIYNRRTLLISVVVQTILIARRVVKFSAGGTRVDHCHHDRGQSE